MCYQDIVASKVNKKWIVYQNVFSSLILDDKYMRIEEEEMKSKKQVYMHLPNMGLKAKMLSCLFVYFSFYSECELWDISTDLISLRNIIARTFLGCVTQKNNAYICT